MALQSLTSLGQITLTNTTTSVNFANIPQNYRDLHLVVNASTVTEGNIFVRINSDSASNYSYVNTRGYNGGLSGTASNTSGIYSNYTTGLTAGEKCVNIYEFFDYSATDKHKTILFRASHSGEVDMQVTRWASINGITSISVSGSDAGAVFQVGSAFSLYGRIA